MRKAVCVALLLSAVVPAFGRDDDAKIRAAVDGRLQEWVAAENKKDAVAVTALYDHDAVLLPPQEEPVFGLAAIRDWHKKFFADPLFVPFTFAVDRNSFHVVGDIAIETVVFEGDATRGAKTIHFRGKHLLVWKQQPDGSWKIFRYMYDEISAKK